MQQKTHYIDLALKTITKQKISIKKHLLYIGLQNVFSDKKKKTKTNKKIRDRLLSQDTK